MVAIVSGNGLGLSLTSLNTLGSSFAAGDAVQGQNGERLYVNVATGNLVLQDRDSHLPQPGMMSIDAVRTYNSLGTLDGNDNWSDGFSMQKLALTGTFNAAGSTIVRTDADGAQATYTFDTSRGLYVCPNGAGAFDTIVYDAANSQVVRTDGGSGIQEIYDPAGRLKVMRDPAGNTLTYSYGTNGLVSSVADSAMPRVRTTTTPATT